MTEENKEEKHYVPHFQKVDEAKAEAQKELDKKKKLKRRISLSEQATKFAKAFSSLLAGTATAQDFADYLAFEQSFQTDAIMKWSMRRSAIQDDQGRLVSFSKTYGEDMSYNEGYQHGLFRFKGEREDVLRKYLENLKQEEETK